MKDNILRYLLILSLILNVSLLSAAGYAHYRQTRYVPPQSSLKVPFPPATAGQEHFFQRLSLKPDQIKRFQAKAKLFHEALDRKRAQVYRLRGELLDLMRAVKPDRKAIEGAVARISGTQKEIQEMAVSHMLEFKSLLDKDQQERFFDLIEGAMAGRLAAQSM